MQLRLKIFAIGLHTAVTVPHPVENRYNPLSRNTLSKSYIARVVRDGVGGMFSLVAISLDGHFVPITKGKGGDRTPSDIPP
jgi:hypothetical protein